MSFYSIILIWTSFSQFAYSIPVFWSAKFLLKSQMIVLQEFPCPLYFAVLCLVTQSCLTLCDPMNCSLSGSSVPGDSPGQNTGVGSLSQPRDWTQVSCIAGRFFTSWTTREASPLYITSCFSLDDFINNILFLFAIFATIFIMCFFVDHFGFICFCTICPLRQGYVFLGLGNFSSPISSYEFSDPSLLGDLYDTVVCALDIE